MTDEFKLTRRTPEDREAYFLGTIAELTVEVARLKRERDRLFVCVVDDEQLSRSRPGEDYYLPKSEAMTWAFKVMAEGTDVSIEERDALAEHDRDSGLAPAKDEAAP
jgi:hypothetical protein